MSRAQLKRSRELAYKKMPAEVRRLYDQAMEKAHGTDRKTRREETANAAKEGKGGRG